MNKIKLINSHLHKSNKGLLMCSECSRNICNIGSGLLGYKITFVCKCCSMGSVDVNSTQLDLINLHPAILKSNYIICPYCNAKLLALFSNNFINIAFRIKCSCGHTFDKFKEYNALDKRLSEYNL